MTSRSAHAENRNRLRRRLLGAVGATPALLAALGAAGCGGTVVVEQSGEGGGNTGGSGNVGQGGFGLTGTGGAGNIGQGGVGEGGYGGWGGFGGSPFNCDVYPGPYDELVYACVPVGGPSCPDATAPETYEAMSAELNWEYCDLGCCDGSYVTSVPCGPDPNTSACCYYAVVTSYSVCEGRPFIVDDVARTAPTCHRSDWLGARGDGPAVSPHVEGLDADTRRALSEAWTGDALFEHASIASFARFSLELLSLGAPPDLVRASQEALGDEIRHAELCFGLASAYAGEAVGPGPLAVDGTPLARSDRREILLSTLREGCVGETIAALIAAGARDAATDPAVKAALDEIADDESKHAELAWRTLAWALDGDAELCDVVEVELAQARPDVSSYQAPRSGEHGAPCSHALRRHGRLADAELVEIAERAMHELVRPCARVMIETARRRQRVATAAGSELSPR